METTLSTTARIDAFFNDLANRGHVDALKHASGTVEFDVENTGRRWLILHQGDIRVSHDPVAPDCVLTTDAETFAGVISGRVNVVAASIRGSVTVNGDIALALSMLRLGTDSNGRQ